MTNPYFEKKALSKRLVLETWVGVLEDECELEEDWTKTMSGVLVGMPS